MILPVKIKPNPPSPQRLKVYQRFFEGMPRACKFFGSHEERRSVIAALRKRFGAVFLEFSGKTAPNRFLKAAMTERLSSWDPKNYHARGIPSKNLINVYKRWGEGGLGLILAGNIMIAYDQLEAPGDPIIPEDAPFSVSVSRLSRRWGSNPRNMEAWWLDKSVTLVARRKSACSQILSPRAMSSWRVKCWV